MTEGDAAPTWERLHPMSFVIAGLKSLPQLALGLPAGLSFIRDGHLSAILPYAAAGALLSFVFGFLFWRRFRFAVTPTELRIESGLFERRRRVIPLERVQDVDIEQGPLHRLLGLAKARVETGGGGKDEGTLDGIAVARATELREQLRGHRAGPWGRAPLPVDEAPLYRLTPGRLILAGLFNFSLVYIAVIFSALQTLDAAGFGPRELAERGRAYQGQVEAAANWRTGLLVLAVALGLGVVTGLVRTTFRDWNYTLARRGRALVRRRGLATVSEVAIALRRIQAAHLSAGPLMRALRLSRLRFQTLGLGTEGGGGMQDAVPLGTPDEIGRVLNQPFAVTLPALGDLEQGPARGLLPALIAPVLLTAMGIAALLAFELDAYLPAPLVLGALLLAGAWLGHRAHRFAVADDRLFLASGWWSQRLMVLPLPRVQAVQLRAGPLARALGLAAVAVDSAGASAVGAPTSPLLPHPAAEALAARLVQKSAPSVSAGPLPGDASPATRTL